MGLARLLLVGRTYITARLTSPIIYRAEWLLVGSAVVRGSAAGLVWGKC